ncbi:serine hydrolase FSH [Podospora didyma]|uniref:Serine hydrolase FSH n=1 Tax=Podospora didyma TaxID=330526 RepID=A0AAE0K3D7_9PEZI|nr:serine hydrolase FSH [Podospora didyma]
MPQPKLLFLHGGGTNANIFRVQSRRLAALLKPHFELVYLNAILESRAGPGVLAFFEDAGPYREWLRDLIPGAEDADESTNSLDHLVTAFRRKGPFVGIVAFSQGAKMAVHLLRRLEAEKKGRRTEFVVAICGTVPYFFDDGGVRNEMLAVKTESVHVMGDNDPYRLQSEKLVDCFDPESRRVVRFKGGHLMPGDESINKLLLNIILHAYDDM